MIFTIAGGVQKDIVAGSRVKCAPGYIPTKCEGQYLTVTKIAQGYPFVRFFVQEQGINENGDPVLVTTQDEESAVSPEIIQEVL